MKNSLKLHVHSDLSELKNKIPFAILSNDFLNNGVYIMQENRIVFIGLSQLAAKFLAANDGKYCPQLKYISTTEY